MSDHAVHEVSGLRTAPRPELPRLVDPRVPLVAIGGSAGAIPLLRELVGALPASTGLAYAVAVHLAPDHESSLAAVLQQTAAMPVRSVEDTTALQADCVHVIPAGAALEVAGDTLRLAPLPHGPGLGAIDRLFASAAESLGPRVIGVLLSGGGHDGSAGLARIRARGGLAIAQDPNEAEHDSMPASAITAGAVDWVLPVRELGPRIVAFAAARADGRCLAPRAFASCETLPQLHARLLARHGPDTLVIDGAQDVVHLSPGAGRYLRVAAGVPSHRLVELLAPPLREALEPLLQRAAAGGAGCEVGPVPLRVEGENWWVSLALSPADEQGRRLLALARVPDRGGVGAATRAASTAARADEGARQTLEGRVSEAAQRLVRGREELAALQVRVDTANADLTVRLEAIRRAEPALMHLVEHVRAAMVVLDTELRVLLYTPPAQRWFRFIEADIGRPLRDLAPRLHHPGLFEDAAATLATGVRVVRQVEGAAGEPLTVRFEPCRGADGAIEGVVLAVE